MSSIGVEDALYIGFTEALDLLTSDSIEEDPFSSIMESMDDVITDLEADMETD